jgi:hypothetical protein
MITDAITLTRDELYVFAVLLGLTAINGLPQDMETGVSKTEAEVQFHCGEHTLVERGWLSYGYGGYPILHEQLIALAGTAALPAATLMIQQADAGGTFHMYLFSSRPGLLVEQYSPRAGLYTFRQLEDHIALAERIKSMTLAMTLAMADYDHQGDETAAAYQELSAECMAGFLSLATSGDQVTAMSVWRGEGCLPSVGQSLMAGLNTRSHWLATAAWNLNQKQPPASRTVMVIEGEAAFWLVESHTSSTGQVRVHRLNGLACQQSLLQLAGNLFEREHEQEGHDAQLAAELE